VPLIVAAALPGVRVVPPTTMAELGAMLMVLPPGMPVMAKGTKPAGVPAAGGRVTLLAAAPVP
jgi:hypothetical protein